MNEYDSEAPMDIVRLKVADFIESSKSAIRSAGGSPYEEPMMAVASSSILQMEVMMKSVEALVSNRKAYETNKDFSEAFEKLLDMSEKHAIIEVCRAEGAMIAQKAIREFLTDAIRHAENGMAATDENGDPIPFSFSGE